MTSTPPAPETPASPPNADLVGPPAPKPCTSCPYRSDVPSGIWHPSEYDKLSDYDRPLEEQPQRLFLCHQNDADSARSRMCAGWVGCHGPDILGLAIALISNDISHTTYHAARDYTSPVPLFGSGAEAAAHGRTDLECPGPAAQRAITKITTRRTDLQ
ncbi:DUF6283 family protein [Nocardia sp. NPDC050697]|uniref:DUF6283 family protein n=1 Tax=Nocardia sp. NPDC050697 TaxID=3155158 RepID=UPI0033D46137